MKLTQYKICQMGRLGRLLKMFYDSSVAYTAVLRSREIRRPNIKNMNADAVFAQEATKAMDVLFGDLALVKQAADDLGISFDLTNSDIIEYKDFCVSHQLRKESCWFGELTDEEKGIPNEQ